MKKFLHYLILLILIIPVGAYAQCPGGETEIVITIDQDRYGSETSWVLAYNGGDTIAEGGPYSDLGSSGTQTHVITDCVLLGADVFFTIKDSYGDGICSGYGDGWYTVEMFDFVFAQGCDFGRKDSTAFTVAAPPDVNVVLEELEVPYFIEEGTIDISGEISNKGANTITSVDFNWTINDGTVNTHNVTGLSIASHETYDFTHNVTWNASGLLTTNDLKVWTSNPNGGLDDMPDNDTIAYKVFILDQVAEKRALIEHFTNASCPPCASQNPVLDALLKSELNEWETTHIAYHTSWPGTDPMYDFNLANDLKNARVSYYGVGGVPNGVLGGNKFQGSPASITQTMIDEDWLRPGLFDITADLTYANDSVYVDVQLLSLADFASGDIVAHVLLVEDLEYSSEPGTNGETDFPDVMRYMFPDVDGTNIGLPNYDDVIDLSFKHEMDAEVSEEMELIIFVQNNSDKDIYGVYQLITDFRTPAVSFSVEDQEENVPVNNNYMVYVDMSVCYAGGKEITDADTLVFLRADSIDGEDVSLTATISSSKKILTINPDENLEAQSTFFVGLKSGLEGYNGTAIAESYVSFKTGWGVGIEKFNNDREIVFYPNPAGNNIYLKLNVKERSDVEIRIYNESGQLVKISDKGKLPEGEHNIDLDMSRLNNGLYFAKVSIGNESVTRKIQIFK